MAKGVLKQLKKGKPAGEISAAKEKSRKWAPSAKQSGDRKKLLAKNNATSVNSLRLVADKIGAPKSTARRIIRDHLRMRPLKHVKTTVSTVAKKKKRVNKAAEILGVYADGMRTNQIFWSDETWVDQDSCARYNPQNDRMYFPKDQKKDDNLDKLIKP